MAFKRKCSASACGFIDREAVCRVSFPLRCGLWWDGGLECHGLHLSPFTEHRGQADNRGIKDDRAGLRQAISRRFHAIFVALGCSVSTGVQRGLRGGKKVKQQRCARQIFQACHANLAVLGAGFGPQSSFSSSARLGTTSMAFVFSVMQSS